MTAFSAGDLRTALGKLGRDPKLRKELIEFLLDREPALAEPGLNVREEVTGPLVDALHVEGELLERTLANGLVFRFPYRSKIARDFVMAADERPSHVWEPQTTKLLLLLGSHAKTVVIGGAYFGDQAIPLAHAMKPHGGVCHCFDLNREEIDALRGNAAANQLPNVVSNQLGLWDKDGVQLELVGDDSHAFARKASRASNVTSSETITIDSYVKRLGVSQLDLIMLDIEGAELAALRGASTFLTMPAPVAPNIVFEVHRSYVDWSHGLHNSDIVRFLSECGYRSFAVRDYQSNVELGNSPIEIIPAEEAYLEGPPHGFNMLAIKDDAVPGRHNLRVVTGVSPKLLLHRDARLHQPLP